MCLFFGTPKNNQILDLEQMEILLFLGVPILRHFMLNLFLCEVYKD